MISPLCGSFLWIKSAFFCWFISQELTHSLFFKQQLRGKIEHLSEATEKKEQAESAGIFFPMKHGGQIIESPWDHQSGHFLNLKPSILGVQRRPTFDTSTSRNVNQGNDARGGSDLVTLSYKTRTYHHQMLEIL